MNLQKATRSQQAFVVLYLLSYCVILNLKKMPPTLSLSLYGDQHTLVISNRLLSTKNNLVLGENLVMYVLAVNFGVHAFRSPMLDSDGMVRA